MRAMSWGTVMGRGAKGRCELVNQWVSELGNWAGVKAVGAWSVGGRVETVGGSGAERGLCDVWNLFDITGGGVV